MSRAFPLESLLRARRLAEEHAAAELERANHHRRAAEEAVGETTDRIAGLTFDDPVTSVAGGGVGVERSWHAVVASRACAAARLGDLVKALEEADVKAEEASRDWTEARRSASMIEKLGERHEARVVAEELRAEQLVLDEAALRGALTKEDR